MIERYKDCIVTDKTVFFILEKAIILIFRLHLTAFMLLALSRNVTYLNLVKMSLFR